MPLNTSPTPSQPGHWVIPHFGPPSVLQWHPLPTLPPIPPASALIRILIAGISGADNIMRAGGYVRDPRTRSPGFTPGYDLVGVIEALGEPSATTTAPQSQPTFHAGDLVASMSVIGAYATHTTLLLDELLPVRPSDDLIKVAALPLN
ncbi:hypothetical protein MMC11_003144 [Xylographa trunciseda]|nr:hypothetical protein [Xylographa trunciseda]